MPHSSDDTRTLLRVRRVGPRRCPISLDTTVAAGLDLVTVFGSLDKKYIIEYTGTGAGFSDYDGDGDLDIYLYFDRGRS